MILSSQPKITIVSGSHHAFGTPVILPDGTIFVSFRTGTSHAGSLGVVQCSVASKPYSSWSAPVTIDSDGTYDLRAFGAVSYGSTIMVSYFSSGISPVVPVTCYVSVSADGGSTWSARREVTHEFTDWASECGLVHLGGTTVLALLRGRNLADSAGGRRIVAVQTSDGGLTWTSPVEIFDGAALNQNHGEASGWRFLDGMIAVVWRYNDGSEIYRSVSTDGGATWSAGAMVFSGSGAPRLVSVDDWTMYVHYRSTSSPYKTAWRTSTDRGQTWSSETILDQAAELMTVYGGFAFGGTYVNAISFEEEPGQLLASGYFQRFAVNPLPHIQYNRTLL